MKEATRPAIEERAELALGAEQRAPASNVRVFDAPVTKPMS
jgi:hypothetical protein